MCLDDKNMIVLLVKQGLCTDMSKKIDEKKKDNLPEKLCELGLSEKEARVYVALLPHRDIGSSKIIRSTGLHGQFVYDALEKLEGKGLAKHVVQNGRKKFTANTPRRILALLEEKRLSAQSIVRQLEQRFAGAHEQDFEVYQGESAFVAHQMDLLYQQPLGERVDVIATETEQYIEALRTYGVYDEYEKVRLERKILVRYIGSRHQLEYLAGMKRTRKLWDHRVLPGLATGIMSIDVWADRVSFITYGEPFLCFTLANKESTDGYRQFFETIWRMAKGT